MLQGYPFELNRAKITVLSSIKILYMLKLFTRYGLVGIVNTILHWLIFFFLHFVAHIEQALSNLGAFCSAVTFSFFANARYTFNAEATITRYMIYIASMGTMSIAVGTTADKLNLPPLFTLISFSVVSLICGFFYSKFIVFRSKK